MEPSTPRPAGPDDLAILLQTGWDAFNRRDIAAIPDLVHDDFEFHGALDQLAPDTYRGREGLERWWTDLWTTYEETRGLPEQVIGIDNHALAVSRFEARGLASGVALARTVFQVAELRASKFAWLHHTFDAAEALRVLADRLEP